MSRRFIVALVHFLDDIMLMRTVDVAGGIQRRTHGQVQTFNAKLRGE